MMILGTLATWLLSLLGAVIVGIGLCRSKRLGVAWLRANTVKAIAVLLALTVAIKVGASKPPGGGTVGGRIGQFIMALTGGGYIDPSGVLGNAVVIAATRMMNEQSALAVSNANAIIAAVMSEYVALTNELAHKDYSVAYIGYDLPRGTPEGPNHNIFLNFMQTRQNEEMTQLEAWVYFSAVPATNVNVYTQASIAPGVWVELSGYSCSYPETELVDGYECYKYCYDLPPALCGVPLKPLTDVAFGGYDGRPLKAPDEGVTVSVGDIDYAPYTGWDDEFTGRLKIRYYGGVAIEAALDGVTIKGENGRYEL